MATATLSESGRRALPGLLLRILLIVLLLILLIAAGAFGAFYYAVKRVLPQVDGTLAVAGLSAPVTVIRDVQGVPHITATNAEDLFFAQGYVTAQDRLWQMDVSRRYAAGDMAEILGRQILEHDREQRILQMRWVAERSAQALPARERSHVEAYVRGVNAFIEQHRDRLPLEFRILRYTPRPWTITDSLLCGVMMGQLLNGGQFETELRREAVMKRIGLELAVDLYPNSSWRDHPPGQDQGISDGQPREASPRRRRVIRLERSARDSESQLAASSIRFDELAPGSNNWVISGAHTATGKPLLSNDMHLGHRIPNVWYEAQLEIRADGQQPPSFSVVGFTIPGLPYVIVGHNKRIAWGFTNLGPDVQDVYIENVNERGEYQTPQGWKPLEVRRETIHVKGAPDVQLDVRITRHGPIISGLIPGEQRALALRWTLYEQPSSAPFFDVDSAQNWQEFRRAFAEFTGPSQNVVYGDVDGHIGYQATGKIPIRAGGDAPVPVPGADDQHEWRGYVPFAELPSVYDPPSGVIATANGRITPDGYKYTLSSEWGSPYRTERIYRLLNEQKKFKAEDMLGLQTDIYSVFDQLCANRFVYAVDHVKNASPRARSAANLMRGWDGRVTTDSSAATVVALARRQLWRLLLEPRLGSEWTSYTWFMSSVALENILARQPARWLSPQFHSYDELLTAAVDAAVSGTGGGTVTKKNWQWGRRFPLELQHPIFGNIPFIRHWSGPGTVPQSGDGFSVKQVGRDFGPSERMTVDFADLDHSLFNVVTGESGQLFSPNYMDQWKSWYGGTSFRMAFWGDAVARANRHELRLVPR